LIRTRELKRMQNKTLDTARANDLGTTDPETTGLCPTDRELAALLDGALEATKAEEVRKHVLACADCYEVYVDAIRFELEQAPSEEVRPNVVRFERAASAAPAEADSAATAAFHLTPASAEPLPSSPSVRQVPAPVLAPPPVPGAILAPSRREKRRLERFPWLRTAAGLVIAAVSAFMFWPEAPESKPVVTASRPALSTPGTGGTIAAAPGVLEKLMPPSQTRGGGALSALAPGAGLKRKFEIGMDSTALEPALQQGTRQEAAPYLNELARHARSSIASDPQARELGNLAADRSVGPWTKVESDAIRKAVSSLIDSETTGKGRAYIDLGRWCEAGRLAAATHHLEFFSAPESRPFLVWLLHPNPKDPDAVDLTDRARDLLGTIEKNWPAAAASPTNEALGSLEKSFAGVITEYSSRTGP
jgi:hypothetical protein